MNNNKLNELRRYGQDHLLKFLRPATARTSELEKQLEEIDWSEMDRLIKTYVIQKPKTDIPSDIKPAPYFPAVPGNPEQKILFEKAIRKGAELIGNGKVAALTVAGGQGTRLGFDGPKGTFPVTPVKNKTLFQYFAEKLRRTGEKYGSNPYWFIMTSNANDAATKDFFTNNDFFGIPESKIVFFRQGTMPAIGLDGKVLLESPNSLALSPNGHGGTLLALRSCGCLDIMKKEGVDFISYFQIDNPLVSVADPLFIGLHCLENSEMSSRMLAKTGPFEKLGNFCIVNGNLNIIEYSDMPNELAEMKDGDNLRFISGSPAIHIISRSFVERLTVNGKLKMPWHRAEKKVPCIDESGNPVKPEKPNAVKLETFIFDALPLAEKTMILEAKREDEFSPVKNPDGVDSVVSCRRMLMDKDARMLEAAGIRLPKKADGSIDAMIEISPLSFIDSDDIGNRLKTSPLLVPERGGKVYYD